MLYGLSDDGKKILATPKCKAICPTCKSELVAKCGSKIARHWAHRRKALCDPWSEETAWHRSWKSIIREDRCEVVIKHGNDIHRADIAGNRNTVIELQHSPISSVEIRAREKYYGNMVWIFDAAGFSGNLIFSPMENYETFVWYRPRTSFIQAKKPIYFHLPCGNIFKPEHAVQNKNGEPLHGWGRFIDWKPFFYLYLSAVVKPEFSIGEQPDLIKNRKDIDLMKLRFHQTQRHKYCCKCDSMREFQNCDRIKKCVENDFIRRVLV
jgi:hypothetical protein